MTITGNYFYGKEVSPYGQEHGYVDYATLASAFDAVLANGIMEKTWEITDWELVSGEDCDEETGEPYEFYQTYIVDGRGAEILAEAGETLWHSDDLDLTVWGVAHWGTSWSYVLTGIKIEKED